jgi:hypothetical protein
LRFPLRRIKPHKRMMLLGPKPAVARVAPVSRPAVLAASSPPAGVGARKIPRDCHPERTLSAAKGKSKDLQLLFHCSVSTQ